MSRTLLEEILKKPQRETAGADTNLRFDYQKNWAFCEMIQRHLKGAEYLVAFEFHDDVVFMEPSEKPVNVDFCQVKTKKHLQTWHWDFTFQERPRKKVRNLQFLERCMRTLMALASVIR